MILFIDDVMFRNKFVSLQMYRYNSDFVRFLGMIS